MKRTLLILFLIITNCSFYAQDFAPIGAEWYYGEGYAFSGDKNYIKFTVVKDTVINGKSCRKITKRHKVECNLRDFTEYMYSSNDSVFYYDTTFNNFQTLYVFDAQPSDSWVLEYTDEDDELDSLITTVDSVSNIQINSQSLRQLHVTYEKIDENRNRTHSSTIIEKIGDVKYMFNWNPMSHIICDMNSSEGLRCYEDGNLGLYSTGLADSCDLVYDWSGIDEVISSIQIEVFPNPAETYVEISISDFNDFNISLFDLNGRLIKSKKVDGSDQKLKLSSIHKGVYFIQIKRDNQVLGYQKLVKQ
jgi:hypothetical protein